MRDKLIKLLGGYTPAEQEKINDMIKAGAKESMKGAKCLNLKTGEVAEL